MCKGWESGVETVKYVPFGVVVSTEGTIHRAEVERSPEGSAVPASWRSLRYSPLAGDPVGTTSSK
jgi:hypothetical protein